MKYFVAVLCLAQIVLSAPQQEQQQTVIEQAQQALATAQQQATAAVSDVNQKFLQATGVKSNEELLNTVQAQAQSYATQLKGVTDQINEQAAAHKTQVDGFVSSITKQIADSAASLLGNQDPAKVDQLQQTFNSVLEQTNSLNTQLKAQGDAAQSVFTDTISKLYDQTLVAARNVASQLDASAKKQ